MKDNFLTTLVGRGRLNKPFYDIQNLATPHVRTGFATNIRLANRVSIFSFHLLWRSPTHSNKISCIFTEFCCCMCLVVVQSFQIVTIINRFFFVQVSIFFSIFFVSEGYVQNLVFVESSKFSKNKLQIISL